MTLLYCILNTLLETNMLASLMNSITLIDRPDHLSLTCLSRLLAVLFSFASSYPGGGSFGGGGACWLTFPFGRLGVGLYTLGPGAAAVAGIEADFSVR